MDRKRAKISIAIDLDPVPGAMHTQKSAEDEVLAALLDRFPHYNPVVLLDPFKADS